jgi:hypothetical protein
MRYAGKVDYESSVNKRYNLILAGYRKILQLLHLMKLEGLVEAFNGILDHQ